MATQQWMRSQEAAKHSGVHVKTLIRAARKGLVIGYQPSGPNGSWKFDPADLDAWVKGQGPKTKRRRFA